MPEMHFHVRWPDERVEACYSPSLVIKDHFVAGTTYALDDFRERSRIALTIAAERVREKYGFLCSRALGQLARIEATAAQFETTPGASVTIVSFGD
ncbi:MSMEG_0570 family nitrogen starvation response protein [Bradyrhizobium guangzhouense]|uniref:MSMEG_0570 family nitrogen starvation response protein n=1 Tax=Bradyrhizobium guangzhouense TaxID=1325095 RepID=A0AAE5WYX0_9BRAD|nr:MSMEG_0570 family nitrogen starvation response protein [Bradyrhizobium guangzhouense]QAU45649.1 MSMEG_0570 family nitrogen starvation response protein [Bradyrhizobium guangzhouense]RXH11795.1 MSMEG_0570 family nitrogen starvation response protein [Bradyrhizobium guangzhouense]RXH18276.1 MSMEG_0570 family nitrogen starvation response protein [Bradyrhizobium guangzhouense]